MPAFVVIDVDVKDPETYATYRKLGEQSVAKYGGRFLARGGRLTVLEGNWSPTRAVVIEFPDRPTAQRWWDSPEYREAREVREGAADFRAVLVDGVA